MVLLMAAADDPAMLPLPAEVPALAGALRPGPDCTRVPAPGDTGTAR